jgi:DNA repair protein RadA/Sms
VREVDPTVVVVDSIQTMVDPDVGSSAGSLTQVRECATRLTAAAKRRGVAVVMVGHVTKDGELAGPRVLEHMVDTVLTFAGERHHALRLLRAVKHRFGSTDELGLFEMRESGLVGLPDPSRLFLADRRTGVSGSVVVPTVEGHRPLLVELQALVASESPGTPRRAAQGVDSGRLAFLLAVLEQRAGLDLSRSDIYALAVGGVRVVEPAADLALALCIASARLDRPVDGSTVAIGEVGLGGEVRQVAQTSRRLAEAGPPGVHHCRGPGVGGRRPRRDPPREGGVGGRRAPENPPAGARAESRRRIDSERARPPQQPDARRIARHRAGEAPARGPRPHPAGGQGGTDRRR